MKEEEAKLKQCPITGGFSLVSISILGLIDGDVNTDDLVNQLKKITYCCSSQCAMWRETRTGEGYCGLAGKE
jgi:hypothetical protein